jgi:hypothetical protein
VDTHTDILVAGGAPLAVTKSASDGLVTVGGLLVVFDGRGGKARDLHGDYFTAETDFGRRAMRAFERGGSVEIETLYNHGFASHPSLKGLADHAFDPMSVSRTDRGLMAEIVLKERDAYEAFLLEMIEAGKLGLSSGTAPHTMARADDGEITRWYLLEGSPTPTPAEPRTAVLPLKSWLAAQQDAPPSGLHVDPQVADQWTLGNAPLDPALAAYLRGVNDSYSLARALRAIR